MKNPSLLPESGMPLWDAEEALSVSLGVCHRGGSRESLVSGLQHLEYGTILYARFQPNWNAGRVQGRREKRFARAVVS